MDRKAQADICGRYLELSGPDMGGRVIHEAPGEIALHATDQVVILRVDAFRDDAECVILHDR